MVKKVLVTGAAGFIGMHTVLKLVHTADEVVGVDNLNAYYSLSLKRERLKHTGIENIRNVPVSGKLFNNYRFVKLDIANIASMKELFEREKFTHVVHLAAQAGVRYSLENPHAYVHSNINGFLNILEECRHYGVRHLIFASSSSVYGLSATTPFREDQRTDAPTSFYAATKKSNELMAHSYSHLFKLRTTGLRFFTVYGPWGRPDMAMFLFTKKILAGEPIEVFGNGKMSRDFTYIDDVVEAISLMIDRPSVNTELPYQIFNLGNSGSVLLLDYITEIEKALNKKAIIKLKNLHPADIKTTEADITSLKDHINFQPRTSIGKGVRNFIEWYLEFYASKSATSTLTRQRSGYLA